MKKNKQKKISLMSYLSKYKFGLISYILVYLIAGACTVLQTIYMAQAISYITDLGNKLMLAIYTFLFVAGLVLVKRVCWFISNYLYQKYANNIMADMNLDLAKQAFRLSSKTYADHDTGTFVQRIVKDPELIVGMLANLVDFITDLLTSLVIVIYITTINIYIGIIIFAIVAVGLIMEYFRNKKKRVNRRDTRKKNDKINSLTTEIVRSEKDIKSLGLEEKLSEVSKSNYDEYKKSSYKTEMTDILFWSGRNFVVEFVGILMLALGVYFIDLGLLTLASFMIIYSNNGNLYSFIWILGNIADSFVEIRVCSERMMSLFDENIFPCEHFGTKSVEEVKGEIEFKNVSYSYVEYESEENEKVKPKKKKAKKERKIESVNKIFDNLSFKIEPNTTVAFVGKSGSGKTTILNLMSKMYEVDSGEVLIDGVNINDFDKTSLRNAISLVNQFPYIFDMTIRENLLLAKKDATEEELESAIKRASLTEFVGTLKKGLDTKVGESGIKLSGGQKQRLAIARALLRNSPIIIFDESTSSLDNFAQEDIKHSIDNMKGQSTIIIVAHRLSTIRNVDKIFFLDEGKIEDIGTFDELFENNVKFKNMFYAENLEN